jgi:hypothetical protein
MKQSQTNLLATLKTTDSFGDNNAADFPATSTGGKQFILVKAAVTATSGLGADQVSAGEETHSSVLVETALRLKLHADLLAISKAAHSLVLLGTAGLKGLFHMPRHDGDQELLNTARAFVTDAAPFAAQMIELKLEPTFIADLNADIADLETAIKGKGAGTGKKAGTTAGIAQTIHDAGIALHVLNTVVPNTYKNDPTKLAEWVVASHIQKHTPVPKPATLAKKAAAQAARAAAKAAKAAAKAKPAN